jgi:aspartate/methionine/tyrosine aminotransferase
MQYCQQKNIRNVESVIYISVMGFSEVIVMSMQALLDSGDEILVPSTGLSAVDCISKSCRRKGGPLPV